VEVPHVSALYQPFLVSFSSPLFALFLYALLIHGISLAKILCTVRWTDVKMVRQAHGLLELWGPLTPVDALEVLI